MSTEIPPVARPNYFTGEALLTADFVCEQRYHMTMLSALNAGLHTYGIASGLDVYWQSAVQSRQVRVGAGMAIDRLGQEIILTQPQIVTLTDVEAGQIYFLTIRYHDTFFDFSTASGVPGYKRILQQPLIEYARTLSDPGLNILLAVINMSSQGTINTLTYEDGRNERRYVGGRFGTLNLITRGSGLLDGNPLAAPTEADRVSTVSMGARSDSDGIASLLEIDAGRAGFSGQLTARAGVGIGLDHPQACLEVRPINLKGPGTITSDGTLLTLTQAIAPALLPGDLIMPDIPLGETAPTPAMGRIAAATKNPLQYTLESPFNPNLSLPHFYSYVRTTLVRVSTPDGQAQAQQLDLLRIRQDGVVGLGLPAAPKGGGPAGPNTLTINPEGQVGIGLSTGFASQAALEVNGMIQGSGLTVDGAISGSSLNVSAQVVAAGPVIAQSFEGNGSKLKDLPILSYWTKQDVNAPNSAIYYANGNVGVQTSKPLASLSVGSGIAFVGNGTVTLDRANPNKLIGFQTQFLSQVTPSDSIQVGTLQQMSSSVARVLGDGELILNDQFPIIVLGSTFCVKSPDGTIQTGNGTISSNGSSIVGAKTQFTKQVKVGDLIQIGDFIPNSSGVNSCLVKSVESDTSLTLQRDMSVSAFSANISAYMVRSSLMGAFQDNSGLSALPPPPALLVASNGAQTSPANTVAINVPLDQLDPTYALQVNGPTNVSGGGTFTTVTTQLLSVSRQATIGGTAVDTSPYRFQVMGGTARVDQDLSVGGATTSNTLTVTGAAQAGSLSVTGNAKAGSLSVAGVVVSAQGAVTLFSSFRRFDNSNLGWNNLVGTYTTTAPTDGFVIASLGLQATDGRNQYGGVLTCNTSSGTSLFTSAFELTYQVPDGKDTKTATVPQCGTLTVPVHQNESWTLTLQLSKELPQPMLRFYWVPLGPGTAAMASMSAIPPQARTAPEAVPVEDWMRMGDRPILSPSTTPAALAQAQRIIEARVGDLSKVLGSVTGMDAQAGGRDAFTQELMKIVCQAVPPQGQDSDQDLDTRIKGVIDTGARAAGLSLNDQQKAMLDKGIRALIQINESPENRQNIDLINSNIGQFVDAMEQALNVTLGDSQRRLMIRALARVVGDGRQETAVETPPPIPDEG
ncbi:MAG: hypothetical protein FD176_882 [Rhodospirillaceae bacterium]|nr:MAG: hypothetical protein FD176_882 [Rhodospirillaceae bacterium]TNC97853.1 MAG: hypothetical protein FD119_841 [Stygiobacter sp.]